MKILNNKQQTFCLVILSILFVFTACNKDLEQFDPIPTPTYPTGTELGATIAANVNDSLYNRIIIRSGLAATLNDSTKTFTMFVPDNNALILSFGGSLAAANGAIAGLSQTACAGIVSYNTLGQKLAFSSIPTTFPNYPYTSLIVLDPSQPFVRMNIFPVRGTPYSYVNNIPVTAMDQTASNGVIHHVGALVQPPSATLKTMFAAESTLSYFRAAVARGDSGSVGTARFDSLFNYAVTNMTVLPPNDAALKPVLFGALYQGLYPLVYASIYNAAYAAAISGGATPAAADAAATAAATAGAPAATNTQATTLAATPAGFNYLPVATVRGIVAYHIMASNSTGAYIPDKRIFSVNMPSTAGSFIKTLVNSSIAAHPGVMTQATFTGPVVSSLKFIGYGTNPPGGTPYSGTVATAVSMDKHAVNGVYHIIDAVLLPQ